MFRLRGLCLMIINEHISKGVQNRIPKNATRFPTGLKRVSGFQILGIFRVRNWISDFFFSLNKFFTLFSLFLSWTYFHLVVDNVSLCHLWKTVRNLKHNSSNSLSVEFCSSIRLYHRSYKGHKSVFNYQTSLQRRHIYCWSRANIKFHTIFTRPKFTTQEIILVSLLT